MKEYELDHCCSNDRTTTTKKRKKDNVLIMKTSGRVGESSLFCNEIKLSVATGKIEQLAKHWEIVTIHFLHRFLSLL